MLAKIAISTFKKVTGMQWDITLDDEYIINPNRIKELKTVNTTGSQFKYMFDPEDDRGDYAYVISTSTVASLVSAADDEPNSSFIALNVFEDDDTTDSVVSTYFRVDDIAFAIAYGNYSWVYVAQGGSRMKRVLVYHNLDAILNLANTGTTTTWLLS